MTKDLALCIYGDKGLKREHWLTTKDFMDKIAVFLNVLLLIFAAHSFTLPNSFKLPDLQKHLLGGPTDCDIKNARTVQVQLTVRDGVKLNTIAHLPLPATAKAATVLIRTPYNAAAEVSYSQIFMQKCWNVVDQDHRGRYASSGNYSFWQMASSDAEDTMAWIVQQEWSNGKVFSFGVSADGIAAYLQPIQKPAMLKAQFIMVGSAELQACIFQNGAYREGDINGWLTQIGEASYIPQVQAHESYGNWWDTRNMDNYWGNVNFPSVHYGGWYDLFQKWTLRAFEEYRKKF